VSCIPTPSGQKVIKLLVEAPYGIRTPFHPLANRISMDSIL